MKAFLKFGNTRSEFAGRSFASKLEASVYGLLLQQQACGLLKEIQCQVEVRLTDADVIYKPDFRFFDLELNEHVFAEAKGFETPEWRIKRRLWTVYGPGRLRIYKGSAARPTLVEEIVPRDRIPNSGGKIS